MDALGYFEEIRKANHHRGGLRCQRLFRVQDDFFARLVDESRRIVERHRPSEVAGSGHATNWTRPFGEAVQYSLLNSSGRFDDFSTDHDGRFNSKCFHHGADYPRLDAFIRAFPHATNMRLNGMGVQSGLSPHEEHAVLYPRDGTAYLRARFHLPLLTNPGAQMLLDGDLYHFEAGAIYYFNNGCIHAARNTGDTSRYHLVWDMMFTPDTFALMFGEDGADLPPFLSRCVGEERASDSTGVEPVTDYAISGHGKNLYDAIDFRDGSVRPSVFHDLYNEAVFLRERDSRFVFSDIADPPFF